MTDQNQTEKSSSKPTHIVRKKFWTGRKSDFETLGVAWERENGGLYIKLTGTQIIEGGFYVFPNKEETQEGGQ